MDENKVRRALILAALCLIGLVAYLLNIASAGATWQPDPNQHPNVSKWFQGAQLMPGASARLHYDECCKNAERLMTKVIPAKDKYGEDVWFYYADPACTWEGCTLVLIPLDTIHDDPIPPGPEFAQLRAEGVLFIHDRKVSCFWKPEPGG